LKSKRLEGRPPVDSPPSSGVRRPAELSAVNRLLTVERESPDKEITSVRLRDPRVRNSARMSLSWDPFSIEATSLAV
jgi:hypothetical protein